MPRAPANPPPTHSAPPAGQGFVPLSGRCMVLRLAAKAGVGPVAVALAASYVQRLRAWALARRPLPPDSEMERVLASEAYCMFCTRPDRFCALPGGIEGCPADDQKRVMLLYLVCLHLAVKLVRLPRSGKYGFNYVAHKVLGVQLAHHDLTALEVGVMRCLDFRLAPLPAPADAALDADADAAPMDEEAAAPAKRAKREHSPTTVMECDEALMSP